MGRRDQSDAYAGLLGFGVLLLIGAAISGIVWGTRKSKDWTKTEGVVALDKDGNKMATFTVSGENYTMYEGNFSSKSVGDKVDVWYKPENPADGHFTKDPLKAPFGALIGLGIGASFFLIWGALAFAMTLDDQNTKRKY